MMPSPTLLPTAVSDADLVQESLARGAAAFSEIVARYQTLVCSLTYNATGNLSRSEDLAQEVFLTAWKQLRQLREPDKLRPWLCGIARQLTANSRRRDGREPVCAATELEDEHHAPDPGPSEQAISREEETILWRSLGRLPENYREPLILFYREGQSVERVAAALDLTEETARQRLSRGRKLLQDQVALVVEGVLRQSTPGRAFTLGVISALPLLTASASAATIGSAAAKGGATAAGAGFGTVLTLLVGPLVGCLGAWFGVKASLDAAETEEERKLIRQQTWQVLGLATVFIVAMWAGLPLLTRFWPGHPTTTIATIIALPLLYAAGLVTMIFRFNAAQGRLRVKEDAQRGPAAVKRRVQMWSTFEYKSRSSFLGLPLIHVRTGRLRGEKLRPALGWIAVGDLAIGLIALGGLSIGGVSLGGLSAGLLAFGGVALGGISFGGLAFGLWVATGGMAVGYLAHGGAALAWHAAQGGVAVARDFAVGGYAQAAHANDALARQAIGSIGFFDRANLLIREPIWTTLVWLPMILVLWQAQRARRALRTRSGS